MTWYEDNNKYREIPAGDTDAFHDTDTITVTVTVANNSEEYLLRDEDPSSVSFTGILLIQHEVLYGPSFLLTSSHFLWCALG